VVELPFAHAFFDTIRREELDVFLESDNYLTIPFNCEVRYETPRFFVGALLPVRVELSYKTTSLRDRSPSRRFYLDQIQKGSFIAGLKLGRVKIGAALPFQDSEQAFPPEFELNLNLHSPRDREWSIAHGSREATRNQSWWRD